MIKKLIEKLEIIKNLNLIKKHFRIAKRHKSIDELEKVKFELLDFQGKLIESNQYSDYLATEIYNLFAEIDYTRLQYIQVDQDLGKGYNS